MPTYKLAPNIAATVEIKYLDIVGGSYGPQVRINGKVDGVDNYVYLPGNLPDQLTQLISQGVIANDQYQMDVAEGAKVAIKPLKKRIQLALDQPAGQKHGQLKIIALSNGNGAPAPAAAAPSASGNFPPLANASAPPVEQHAPQTDEAKPSLKALYKSATAFVLTEIVPLYVKAEIGCTDEAVGSMVATLFIAAAKERG